MKIGLLETYDYDIIYFC